jgi:ABC-type lipoprotein export system ATPase subunit
MRQGDGIRHETLFRDETVGALDTKNAREYVRMLRHAMDIGGFYQVIFICHAPQVWELADRILTVRDGRVFVEARGVSGTAGTAENLPISSPIPGTSRKLVESSAGEVGT